MPETVDLKLTPEMAEKLKGFLAIDVNAKFKYVPKAYRNGDGIPKEFWPIFTLNGKDAIDLAKAEDSAGVMEIDPESGKLTRYIPRAGSSRITTLKDGIDRWKNFRNEKGELIEYVNSDSISCLPVPLQTELQDAINERKTLTEEELRGLE